MSDRSREIKEVSSDLGIPRSMARASLLAIDAKNDADAERWLSRGRVPEDVFERVLAWVEADLADSDDSPAGAGHHPAGDRPDPCPGPAAGQGAAVDTAAAAPARRTLVLPASYDDTTGRPKLIKLLHQRLGAGDWQVEALARQPDRTWLATALDGPVAPLAGAKVWTLGETVRPSDAPRVAAQAAERGLSLLRWAPHSRRAVVGPLTPFDASLRRRIAARLRHEDEPWTIELSCRWTVDERTGEGRIAEVIVYRHPEIAGSIDKIIGVWRDEIVPAIPGGSLGWSVSVDQTSAVVVLRYGRPPALPPSVDLAELLPDTWRPEEWATLPMGIDPSGAHAGVDLSKGPHSLTIGPTGTGKSVSLRAMMTAAIARGHEVAVIDPIKGGGDFIHLRPWISGWADDYSSAQHLLEYVYAEVARRKAVQLANGVTNWFDLDPAVCRSQRIRPWLVVIDEYVSLVLPRTVNKALPDGHPLRAEAEEQNISKAVIAELAGRLAREARFVGIHLALAAQRPDAKYLEGEFRSNLTSGVALSAPADKPADATLRMIFDSEGAMSAAEMFKALDDGNRKGLAGTKAEGGTIRGFRVAFAPPQAIPAMLNGIGVPHARPWDADVPAHSAPSEREPNLLVPKGDSVLDDDDIWGDTQ